MQIFYLETNEEVPSIIERIRSSSQQEVVLAVPVGALLLQSIVNLKLVKREAEKNQKTLYLVTTDKIGRNLASQVGLTVYERIERGQVEGKAEIPNQPEPKGEATRSPKPDENQPESIEGVKIHRYYTEKPVDQPSAKSAPLPQASETLPGQAVLIKENKEIRPGGRSTRRSNFKFPFKLVLILIILGLIALAGAGFWALPLTQIQASVKAEDLTKELDLVIATNNSPDQIKGNVSEFNKSASKNINSTGKKDIGEKAKGQVTVYNEYSSSPQPLQAGTRMQTSDGKVYRLDSDIVVPGGEFEVEGSTAKLTKAGTTNTTASADQPGDSYNISSANLTFPGIGRDNKIYAKTSGFTGGVSKTVKVVSANDVSDARIDLTNDLSGQISEELKKQSPELIIIETGMEKNITTFTTSQNVDAEAENFQANATIKVRFLTYNSEELKNLVIKKSSEELENNQEFILDKEKLKVEYQDVNLNDGKAAVHVTSFGKVIIKIDEKDLERRLRSKNFQEAEKMIQDLPQVNSVKISSQPSWWPKRISSRPQSLKLDFKYE